MAIVRNDLQVFRAATNNELSGNGGRMSAIEVISSVLGNVFPDVTQAERLAGVTKLRKLFFKNGNTTDIAFANARYYVENYTPAEDEVFIHLGSQIDTQGDLTGSESLYGAGQLNADVNSGVSQVDVLVHDGNVILFRDGDLIRISDKTDIDDVSGNEERHRISGVPVVNGDVITITLATTLANAYLAASTRVTSMIEYEPDDVVGIFENLVVTSAGDGAYDPSGDNLTVHNEGGIEQSWTLTFTSATDFDLSGNTVGSVGSGNISSNFTPTNPDFASPYFTLNNAGFSGTFQAGDTITFDTHPAAVPIWVHRVVPAGAAAFSGNSAVIVQDGESAE